MAKAEAVNSAADMSNDEIDRTVAPILLDIVRTLVGAGRPPRQAMQDIRRNIDHIEKLYDEEQATGVATS